MSFWPGVKITNKPQLAIATFRCTNCGHLDFHLVETCAVCGQRTRDIEDISDVLIGVAVRNGIEIVYIEQDPEFEKIGHIAALLRFRADQNTSMKQAG